MIRGPTVAVGAFGQPKKVFKPTQLSGCVLWLRADMGVTVVGSDVSALADQSGASHDVVQATGSLQPDLTSQLAALNNRAAIVYDGADDRLVSDDAASEWAFLHNGTGATIAIIAKIADAPAAGQMFLFSTLRQIVTRIGVDLALSTDGNANLIMSNGTSFLISPAVVPPDTGAGGFLGAVSAGLKMLWVLRFGATSYSVRLNRAQLHASNYLATPSAAAPFGTLHVGHIASGNATEAFDGAFTEMTIWNRSLPDSEVFTFERYAASRYAL